MGDTKAATEQSAQAIESRVEESLFGKAEESAEHIPPQKKEEPIIIAGEEVLDDDLGLPDDDDSDLGEDDGSGDLETIASDEDLTLAGYLGIDEDKLVVAEDGKVSFNAVIDGEAKVVPLEELAKSFQLQGHVNNKSIALENDRKQFTEQVETVSNELLTRVQGLDKLSTLVEEQLVAEFNNIDWDRLRVENPAEWTAMRSEYAEKAQRVQKVKTLIGEEGKRLSDEYQLKSSQQYSTHMKSELNKVIANNPQWADEKVRTAEVANIRTFLSESYGFGEEDMQYVTDARLVELIKDARSYRQGKVSAESKKVKSVPKFQKPGASKAKSAQLAKARKVKAHKAAIKKGGGNLNDIAASLIDRM